MTTTIMAEASGSVRAPHRSSMKYSTHWATFTGYPLISQWNLDHDAEALLAEVLRTAAELRVSAPVERRGGTRCWPPSP